MSDDNFRFLTDYITSKITEWIIKEEDFSLEEALLLFHNSETFQKLSVPKTDLYIESPAYVYEIFQEEQRKGSLTKI